MKLTIIRYKEEKRLGTGDVVTPGLLITDIDGANPIDLVTLEAAWHNNERGISCLPPGIYELHAGREINEDHLFGAYINFTIVGGSAFMTQNEATGDGRYGLSLVGRGENLAGNIGVGTAIQEYTLELANSMTAVRYLSSLLMNDYRRDIPNTLEIEVA